MLVAVAPDLPGGAEAFAVGSDADWDTEGWTATDGEGTVAIPPMHLATGSEEWLVSDLAAWRGLQGAEPAAAWQETGAFQLANAGEGLRLVAPDGHDADAFAWGKGTVPGMSGALNRTSEALVYTRDENPAWIDTDRAADWTTPRLHRVGESHLGSPTFTVNELTLYSSPDSSHEVLSGLVAQARTRLHLHVYEFGSLDLAHRLAEAKRSHPALDLQVLVDSAPVGLTAPARHRETQAMREIQAAGGTVLLAGHGRYDYHHLKVLVADETVAVQSENWVDSGVPRDPTTGNRGWGVAVTDPAMADWFAAWMADDRAAWDTAPFDAAAFDPLAEPVSDAAPRSGAYGPVVPAVTLTGEFQVTPLVSPDATQDPRHDPVAALVDAAQKGVAAQELDVTVTAANPIGWSSPDPLAESLERAAGRGVDVRVLAAAPFSDEEAGGNAPALAWLQDRGVAAATIARPGILTLHNKGIVVDDRIAVVGSMNANHHSRSENREVALVLEGPGVAPWFQALFDSDWQGVSAGPDSGVIGKDIHSLPGAQVPSLLAVVGVVVAVRVRSK